MSLTSINTEKELFRQIQAILSDLNSQNFDILLKQFTELTIDTVKKLAGTVHLIFENAIVAEPKLCSLYANICKRLKMMKVPSEDGTSVVTFIKLLLTKCQTEFQNDKNKDKEDKMKSMKATTNVLFSFFANLISDNENPEEYQLEKEKNFKLRQIGNIRFIGELLKVDLLIEEIVFECMEKLLTRRDDESLECLFHLLLTCGKELQLRSKNRKLDLYFVSIQKIVDDQLPSLKVRTMLQGLIELKQNGWNPPRNRFNQKSCDQIMKEAEEDTHEILQGCNCSSQHSIALHFTKLLQDYQQLFLNKEECDVIIKVKGQEFQAHKAILIARSPVFASILKSDMKEKATGIIDIQDCDPSIFLDFLNFLYCGNVDNLSKENIFSLFSAADKYHVEDLRSICLEFMKKNLSVNTFCDTITVALLHVEKELLTISIEFFAKYLEEIIVTVKWQTFLVENPIQGNEILIKALVSNKK